VPVAVFCEMNKDELYVGTRQTKWVEQKAATGAGLEPKYYERDNFSAILFITLHIKEKGMSSTNLDWLGGIQIENIELENLFFRAILKSEYK